MIWFFKKYKAFIIGYSLTLLLFYWLYYLGIIIVQKEQLTRVLAIYGSIWGTIISLLIYYYKRFKKTISRVLVLFVMLFTAMAISTLMKVPDNPITFILLLAFWLCFAYMLVPNFFKKYWRLISLIYGTLLFYFLYLRLFNGDLDVYLKNKEELPFYFFIPIPLLFILWVFEQWKWLQKLKSDKSEAELSMLRSQINPHFFFNTLNNLHALSLKKSDDAPDVILKLSDMMRYTIYEGEKEKIALKEEIEYLNNYIQLHKIRYKKSVEIRFDHDVDTSLKVAPLLFIILLENAFKHGVETLSENAYIHINLSEDEENIIFEIENNYDPSESTLAQGIGLKNLKRRLSLLYKNRHVFTISKINDVYNVNLKISKHA